MHMVLVRANLQKLDLIAGLDPQTYFPRHLIDRRIDHRSPVLGRKHQVGKPDVTLWLWWAELLIHRGYAASGGECNPEQFSVLMLMVK